MPFSIRCAECGISHTARHRSARFCSLECAYRHRTGETHTEQPASADEVRKDIVSGDERSVSLTIDREIRNEKDLMEVCRIDPKEWRIADGWECTAWEASAKDDTTGKLVKRTLFRVKARFVRNHQVLLTCPP